ncbi:MAG: PD-(D/E)XK nuclease family protein [Rickettsiales bacterium]|jgi:ATP-dependent helicase/nuclease subunit B|nr:PD-(D/E)XK nuclease family protein [Rickettsiales bacterium]
MRVFSVRANYDFLRSVHRFLEDNFGNTLDICDVLLLLPNRRSVNALRTVFLEASADGARAIPTMRAIGDIDEEVIVLGGTNPSLLREYLESTKTTSPVGYRLLLLREILANGESSIERAIGLAKELDAFLADMESHEIDFSRLDNLVEENLAIHWQQILGFLRNFGAKWHGLLDRNNLTSTQSRRVSSIRFYEKILLEAKPENPVLMIGNFDPLDCTLDLMRAMARRDNSYIILRGLESTLTDEEFAAVDELNSHFLIKKTLEKLALERRQVVDLAYPQCRTVDDGALGTIGTAMLPSKLAHRWQRNDRVVRLGHIHYLECQDISEELNLVMVYLLDHIAENGLGNIALVANQELAQRLELLLGQWNLPFNNTYGKKFLFHGVVRYLVLLLEVYSENYKPSKLLSLLKNNFVRFGYGREKFLRNVSLFERHILQDRVNEDGMESYRINLGYLEDGEAREELTEFLDRIEAHFNIFPRKDIPLGELILGHLELAERVASSPETDGASVLWHSDSGSEKILEFFRDELLPQAKCFGDSNVADYGYLLNFLLSEKSYSDDYSLYPAVNIISLQETQLINYDLVVLMNMNDGVNPPGISPDPWMSRRMRTSLGLPAREVEIGKSYFNLVQLVAQKKVLITRSRTLDGLATIKSRFLQRLETTLRCNGLDLEGDQCILESCTSYHSFSYDRRNDIYKRRPQPKPPLELRPRSLSATNVDLLNLNPYDLYAKKILSLAQRNPLARGNIHAKIGTILHSLFEQYSKNYDSYRYRGPDALASLVRDTLRRHFSHSQVLMELYFRRVLEATRHFALLDGESRREGYSVLAEEWRSYEMEGAGGFTLFARIDRIERLHSSLRIVDYKTGTAPTRSDVLNGRRLQLPVEALIMARTEPGASVDSLQYWLIRQRGSQTIEIRDGEKIRNSDELVSLGEMVRKTEEFVLQLARLFDREDQSYLATNRNSQYSDFGHLSRLGEWLCGESPV